MQRVDGLRDGNLTIENVAALGRISRQLTILCETWPEYKEPSEAPALQPALQPKPTVQGTKSRSLGVAPPQKRVPTPTEGDDDDGGREHLEASALTGPRTTQVDPGQEQYSFLASSADPTSTSAGPKRQRKTHTPEEFHTTLQQEANIDELELSLSVSNSPELQQLLPTSNLKELIEKLGRLEVSLNITKLLRRYYLVNFLRVYDEQTKQLSNSPVAENTQRARTEVKREILQGIYGASYEQYQKQFDDWVRAGRAWDFIVEELGIGAPAILLPIPSYK